MRFENYQIVYVKTTKTTIVLHKFMEIIIKLVIIMIPALNFVLIDNNIFSLVSAQKLKCLSSTRNTFSSVRLSSGNSSWNSSLERGPFGYPGLPPPLCVQMNFTRTFQANNKCNNTNHVWSHFYKILVVLKYHRHPWGNIFDTDISKCINTYIKVVFLAFFGIFMLLQMSVSKILAQGRLWYFKTTKIL